MVYQGWSTRMAGDGVTEFNGNDSLGWYRWSTETGRHVKVYLDAAPCPHCSEKHPPPFDGGCLI